MDVSIVPVGLEASSEPISFSGLEPKFQFAKDEDGLIKSSKGVSSLASRVLYYLFTSQGSDPLHPQAGGSINRLVGSVGDRASFSVRISRAIIEVEDTIRAQQSSEVSLGSMDSRLKSIKLLSLEFPTPDSANITILILAESGKSGAVMVEV